MNSPASGPPTSPRMPRRPGKKSAAGIALACAAAAYAFLAPIVNERFGLNLPDLKNKGGQAVVDGSPTRSTASKTDRGGDKKASVDDSDLKYGLLRAVGDDRYVSPAGLMYTPGSAEGHRLKHVERHTNDDPGRPGSHGVFDGGMEGALETIDKAYERAKKKQKTTVKQERGSTVYTVDMGGRIGYVGGQTGQRKRNPMARRVKIVLDGNRVITAFPM